MMTSRERVLCALEHEEPDRVPIFFGTSGATTMLAPGYDRLKAYLSIERETQIFWRGLQYVLMDEEVLAWSGSDGRPLLAGPAPATLDQDISENAYVDGWGCLWERRPGVLYYEVVDSPIRTATIESLDYYPWPDLAHPSRFVGLREQAKAIQDAGYAVVMMSGVSPFEQSYLLRGVEQWMLDLAGDPDFALALMRKVTDLQKASVIKLLDEAGGFIDVLVMGDDLGSQTSTLISPKMYRQLIKPFHIELMTEIKKTDQGQDILSFRRQHLLAATRLDRDRGRSAQPGTGQCRRHGRHGAAQAEVRRPAVLLRCHRYRLGVAERYDRRCARRGAPSNKRSGTRWRLHPGVSSLHPTGCAAGECHRHARRGEAGREVSDPSVAASNSQSR